MVALSPFPRAGRDGTRYDRPWKRPESPRVKGRRAHTVPTFAVNLLTHTAQGLATDVSLPPSVAQTRRGRVSTRRHGRLGPDEPGVGLGVSKA